MADTIYPGKGNQDQSSLPPSRSRRSESPSLFRAVVSGASRKIASFRLLASGPRPAGHTMAVAVGSSWVSLRLLPFRGKRGQGGVGLVLTRHAMGCFLPLPRRKEWDVSLIHPSQLSRKRVAAAAAAVSLLVLPASVVWSGQFRSAPAQPNLERWIYA